MDTNSNNNLQTSFIPKKPLAEERAVVRPHNTSLFSFIATILFIGALASAGGLYFYKASLQKSITSMNTQLDAARNAFEPSLITELQTLNRRITDSNELLSNHVMVSPIFEALQINTLKSIQFTKFSYDTPTDPTASITVHMSGRARDYASIALQSDQLATNKNIHNSIFSNLALDLTTGTVTFDLVFTVDPSLVRYTNHLDDLAAQQGTPTTTDTSATPTQPTVPATTNTGAPAGTSR